MKKDNLEKLFERLQGSFDTQAPKAGHRERFLEKLDVSEGFAVEDTKEHLAEKASKRFWWRSSGVWKPMAVAASIAILCIIAFGIYEAEPTMDQQIAEISPEVSRTQSYFAGLIEQQVDGLKSENSPKTRRIIDDALVQLEELESDYAKLEEDLVNGGNSKLILGAMITNFRTRIDLLQEVTHEIEYIKKLNITDDTETTI
jgi:hypothetical protein